MPRAPQDPGESGHIEMKRPAYYNLSRAARMLGITDGTLRRYLHANKSIRPIKNRLDKRQRLLTREQLEVLKVFQTRKHEVLPPVPAEEGIGGDTAPSEELDMIRHRQRAFTIKLNELQTAAKRHNYDVATMSKGIYSLKSRMSSVRAILNESRVLERK